MTGLFTVIVSITLYYCFSTGGVLGVFFAAASTLGNLALCGVFKITSGICTAAERISIMANIKFGKSQNNAREISMGTKQMGCVSRIIFFYCGLLASMLYLSEYQEMIQLKEINLFNGSFFAGLVLGACLPFLFGWIILANID